MKPLEIAQPGTFTGRHMLFLVLGFFGVIFAVNITMAVISSVSWTGLVVDNSYVASQEFEQKRLAHEAQQAAGWQPVFEYAPGVATLSLQDGAGQPVELGVVTIKFNRPVGGHDDQTATLEASAAGVYTASVQLADGVWDAWIDAPVTAKGPFELHERFKLGADQP